MEKNQTKTEYRLKTVHFMAYHYRFLQFKVNFNSYTQRQFLRFWKTEICYRWEWYYIPKKEYLKEIRPLYYVEKLDLNIFIGIHPWQNQSTVDSFIKEYPNIEMYIDKYSKGDRYGKED